MRSMQLGVGLICRDRRGDDLFGDLLDSRFTSGLAFPAILVRSIDTTPDFTNPAFSHSFKASVNRPANAN